MNVANAARFMIPGGVRNNASRVLLVMRVSRERVGRFSVRLSGAERAVARSFMTRISRADYVLSRAACHMLGIEAPNFASAGSALRRKRDFSARSITVSLSHARGVMAFATADHEPIGVDVEPADAPSNLTAGIRRMLRGAERLGDDRACWNAWCRKEALAKATKQGLIAIRRLPVVDDADCNALLADGSCWTVRSVKHHTESALGYALRGRSRLAKLGMVSMNQLHFQSRTRHIACN